MSYLFLLLLMSFNAVMPVTVLEKVENSPFLCNVNANCSGSIVKYKNSLFLFTANHCMTFKQDKVFCAYKDDGTYDYTVIFVSTEQFYLVLEPQTKLTGLMTLRSTG